MKGRSTLTNKGIKKKKINKKKRPLLKGIFILLANLLLAPDEERTVRWRRVSFIAQCRNISNYTLVNPARHGRNSSARCGVEGGYTSIFQLSGCQLLIHCHYYWY